MSVKNWFKALFGGSITEDRMEEMEREAIRAKDEIRLTANAVFNELRLKTRKGSIQGIKNYLDEVKKDIRILKNTTNRIYVEWNNFTEQIKRLEGDK